MELTESMQMVFRVGIVIGWITTLCILVTGAIALAKRMTMLGAGLLVFGSARAVFSLVQHFRSSCVTTQLVMMLVVEFALIIAAAIILLFIGLLASATFNDIPKFIYTSFS